MLWIVPLNMKDTVKDWSYPKTHALHFEELRPKSSSYSPLTPYLSSQPWSCHHFSIIPLQEWGKPHKWILYSAEDQRYGSKQGQEWFIFCGRRGSGWIRYYRILRGRRSIENVILDQDKRETLRSSPRCVSCGVTHPQLLDTLLLRGQCTIRVMLCQLAKT